MNHLLNEYEDLLIEWKLKFEIFWTQVDYRAFQKIKNHPFDRILKEGKNNIKFIVINKDVEKIYKLFEKTMNFQNEKMSQKSDSRAQ